MVVVAVAAVLVVVAIAADLEVIFNRGRRLKSGKVAVKPRQLCHASG